MNPANALKSSAALVMMAMSTPSWAQTSDTFASAKPAQTSTPAAAPADAPQAVGLQDIIVTAERHNVALQKAPLTITAIDGGEIRRKGVVSYEAALQQVPGVQLQQEINGDSTQPSIAIRGVGTDGGNKPPSTAVYVDGIIVSNENLQFYDLARVEVLSGPQATLYGGVATAGAVNIITNNPSLSHFDANARVNVGNAGLVNVDGMVNVPLTPDLAVRGAVNALRRDNYFGSAGNGRTEINGRMKLLYEPTAALSVLLGGEIYHFSGVNNDVLYALDAKGSPSDATLIKGFGHIDTEKVYATVKWNMGWANLTWIPGYQTSNTKTSALGIPFTPAPASFNVDIPYYNVLTQELRLANHDGSPVTWVAGMYFRHSREDKRISEDLSGSLPGAAPVPGFGPLYFTQTIGIDEFHPFAQATVPVRPGLRLTGGISYSNYTLAFPAQNLVFGQLTDIPFKQTYTNVDGLARIEGDLTSHNLLYASFSTGYRPGGPAGGGGEPYAKETVHAYEVGSKNRFWGNKLEINLDAYFYDYPNFQNLAQLSLGNGAFVTNTTSVPAHIYGIEGSIAARPTRHDTLSLQVAWQSAHYTADAVEQIGNGQTASLSTANGVVTHAPKWNLNGEYSHTFDFDSGSSLLFNADGHYQTSQPVDFDGCVYAASDCTSEGFTRADFIQKAYAIVDTSLTFTLPNKKYSISAYGRNLTNHIFKTGFQQGYANVSTPRTYGVVLAAKW